MRLLSFRNGAGPRIGARADGALIDLVAAHEALRNENGAATPPIPSDMVSLPEGGDAALDAARAALEFAAGRPELPIAQSDVQLLPVVPRPPKVPCVPPDYGQYAPGAGPDGLGQPNRFIPSPQRLPA